MMRLRNGYCTIIVEMGKLKKPDFDQFFANGTLPIVHNAASTLNEMVEQGIPHICAGGNSDKGANGAADGFGGVWYAGHKKRVKGHENQQKIFAQGCQALADKNMDMSKAVKSLAHMISQCRQQKLDDFFKAAQTSYLDQPDSLATGIRMLYDYNPQIFPGVKPPKGYKQTNPERKSNKKHTKKTKKKMPQNIGPKPKPISKQKQNKNHPKTNPTSS